MPALPRMFTARTDTLESAEFGAENLYAKSRLFRFLIGRWRLYVVNHDHFDRATPGF